MKIDNGKIIRPTNLWKSAVDKHSAWNSQNKSEGINNPRFNLGSTNSNLPTIQGKIYTQSIQINRQSKVNFGQCQRRKQPQFKSITKSQTSPGGIISRWSTSELGQLQFNINIIAKFTALNSTSELRSFKSTSSSSSSPINVIFFKQKRSGRFFNDLRFMQKINLNTLNHFKLPVSNNYISFNHL